MFSACKVTCVFYVGFISEVKIDQKECIHQKGNDENNEFKIFVFLLTFFIVL